jgi:hypothetical protein
LERSKGRRGEGEMVERGRGRESGSWFKDRLRTVQRREERAGEGDDGRGR